MQKDIPTFITKTKPAWRFLFNFRIVIYGFISPFSLTIINNVTHCHKHLSTFGVLRAFDEVGVGRQGCLTQITGFVCGASVNTWTSGVIRELIIKLAFELGKKKQN